MSDEAALLPTATRTQTWAALRTLSRGHRRVGCAALAFLLLGTAAGLLVPPILGDMVDRVLEHRGADAMTGPVLLLVALAVAQASCTVAGTQLVARFGETMLATLRERVLDRALGLPLGDVERAGTGDVLARTSGDVSVVATAVRSALPALASAALTIGLTAIGLAALDWRFALSGLLAAPIQLYTLRWYLRRSSPIFAAERVGEGARAQQLLDSVGGAATVRAYGLSEAHLAAVADRSRAAIGLALDANRLATRFYGRLNFAEFVGLAAILATGFWLVRDGAVTVGTTAAAALYFHRLFDPVNALLSLFGDAQEAAAGLARLVGVADAPTPLPAAQPLVPASAALALHDVRFGYRPERPVLHEVDVEIAAGEHVALVGTSGAGKSTIARLAAGVYGPSDGTVSLGGVPVAELEHAADHVALVTQETHVFAGPLADDLRLVAPHADDAGLRVALETVGALEWALALPDGLATVVGDGGVTLTATQAQQLALARIVLADPPAVVLDEATADAGSAGARQLDHAAAAALRGRTALVVAHRLSQAVTADRICVVTDGRIVESGSPDTLARRGGEFARLWSAWSVGRSADGRR